jgi:hypothetical protein
MENKNTETRYKLNHDRFDGVLKDKKISSGVKLLLFYLNRRRGYKLYCWPSQWKISKDLGVSPRQVRNQLVVLKNLKLIVWKKGKVVRSKASGEYRVASNRYDFTYITYPYEYTKKV